MTSIENTLSTFPSVQPSMRNSVRPKIVWVDSSLKVMTYKCFRGDNFNLFKLKKFASPILTPFLTKLINDCITNGIFPKCLKRSRVKPRYKSGDIHDPSNYRPISLLSCISKFLRNIKSANLSIFY